MIVTKIEVVYEVYLPPEVRALLANIRFIISLGLEGIPLACVGANGYVQRLLFWMLFPLALVLLAVLLAVIDRCCRRKGNFSVLRTAEEALPNFLRLGFVVYPLVANVTFISIVACLISSRHTPCAAFMVS